MKKLTMLFLALCIMASLAVPASAVGPMEYTFDGPGDPEYGKPTSIQGSHGSPAQRVPWEKEEQGSERSFPRQRETELSGLCDDVQTPKAA